MANTYSVIADVNARSDRTGTGAVTASYKTGDEVKIYTKELGTNNVLYGNASSSAAKWVNMNYLRMMASDGSSSNEVEDVYDDTIYGNSDEDYNNLLLRYTHALGSPPKYTKEVDPWYDMPDTIGVGRAMGKTWFCSPSILSICPVTVDYLPGFS